MSDRAMPDEASKDHNRNSSLGLQWSLTPVVQSFTSAVSKWTLLTCCVAVLAVNPAAAQMDFSLDDAETPTEEAPEEAPAEGEGDGMSFTEGDATAEGEGTEGEGEGAADFGEGEGEGTGDVIGDLTAGATEDTGPREEIERVTETKEEIYAVQQVYALRLNRVELAPSVGFVLNDPYASHTSVGVALNYWFTNVLALGVNFQWFQGLDSESNLNFFVRRSTRLAIPITEWQLGAQLNFTYVPLYGKFAAFNKFIFQWDAYVIGGVGLMRTRPIPVIDPQVRKFDFGLRVAFNAGVGVRVFLSRFLSVFIEFRNYMYLERNENLIVGLEALDADEDGLSDRVDPDTWLDESNTFTNNTTVQVGFTIFFPFKFEYKLPK